MKLKFGREVRKSIADELKKIANFGGVGLSFMSYSRRNKLMTTSLTNYLIGG